MYQVFKDKRILVTGHTGFKGGWLTYWLWKLGAKVSGYSKDLPTNPCLYEQINLKNILLNDFREDILDFNKIYNAIDIVKPEYIFHLAAQPIVSKSYLNPIETFSTNLIGSLNLFEAIRKSSLPAIAVFITSDKCYENKEWIYGYREKDKLGGKDPYSASKACAEVGLRSLGLSYPNRNFRYATARAGNVIGGGDWSLDRVVPDCIRKWQNCEPVVLRNPNATRPWQHVLEPISGYLTLADYLTKDSSLDSESFNFGPITSQDVTVEEVCKLLSIYWPKSEIEINSDISIGIESGLLKLDISKAFKSLNWQPKLNIDECAYLTSNWYLKHKNGTLASDLCEHDIKFYLKK